MNVLIDSCFWYAYYDSRDEKHDIAVKLMGYLEEQTIVIPYPLLYETINTRFSKRMEWISLFNELVHGASCQIVSDEPYKADALDTTFAYAMNNGRPMSLVDMVLRLMVSDVNLKIDAVISFNVGDFIDVCRSKGIELLCE